MAELKWRKWKGPGAPEFRPEVEWYLVRTSSGDWAKARWSAPSIMSSAWENIAGGVMYDVTHYAEIPMPELAWHERETSDARRTAFYLGLRSTKLVRAVREAEEALYHLIEAQTSNQLGCGEQEARSSLAQALRKCLVESR